MITINLDFHITGLDGQKIEAPSADFTHAGKLVANTLGRLSKGNSIKLLAWAMDLYNKGKVAVDTADYDTLYKTIEEAETLTVLAKGQILQALKKSKDAVTPKSAS